jgi:predicted lipoprotein with Yx(FWY)xxD motif
VNHAGARAVSPRMRTVLAVVPATLLLAFAGAAPAGARTTVKTHQGPAGTFLADGHGRTLYLFAKDTTRKSRCSGPCTEFWPPLIAKGRPHAGAGVKASKLSTSRRAGGARQVVYAGHPLYRYVGDAAPGDTTGEGLSAFGARWWLVSPAGRRITSDSGSAFPGY